MAFWIVKTEPGTYSFSQLERDVSTAWDGVRNYQARNNLRKMSVGDLAMVYHSVGPKDLVGIAQVTSTAVPDATATDGDWSQVGMKFDSWLTKPVNLATIKADARLSNLSLVKQGRLSVCPVSAAEWKILVGLSEA